MEINSLVHRFRLASRDLFNHFFRVEDPYENEDAWAFEERYSEVEALLFEKLVLEPANLPVIRYGSMHPAIGVEIKYGEFAPVMLNRELDSGYWDDPIKEVTSEAKLAFISFFDWDQLDYRDHRYVRVQVLEWPSQPHTIGKHALIETHYVIFKKNECSSNQINGIQ